jgi:hypothetical protein
MTDELDFIEALDDLSNIVQSARELLNGDNGACLERPSSTRNGLILSDLGDDDDAEYCDGSTLGLKHLWTSWQTLIEIILQQRIFLQYTNGLERCITAMDDGSIPDDGRDTYLQNVQCLVNLMLQTVEQHAQHESTELRFATLLEIVRSYSPDWIPSKAINELWQLIERIVEADCDPDIFRREAYKILVALPWSPESSGLYVACSYQESEAIHPDLPPHIADKLRIGGGDEESSSLLLRSDKINGILQKIDALEKEEDQETFTIAISYTTDDNVYSSTATSIYNGHGVGKTTLAALIAAHPQIAEQYPAILWADLGESSRPDDAPLSYQQYADCLEGICKQLGVAPNWPDRILRLEDDSIRIRRESEYIEIAKEYISLLLERSGLRILMVIDGTKSETDFELFQFTTTQSNIVVSKANGILDADSPLCGRSIPRPK